MRIRTILAAAAAPAALAAVLLGTAGQASAATNPNANPGNGAVVIRTQAQVDDLKAQSDRTGLPVDKNVDVPAGVSVKIEWLHITGNVSIEGQVKASGDTFDRNVSVSGPGSQLWLQNYASRIGRDLNVHDSSGAWNGSAGTSFGDNHGYNGPTQIGGSFTFTNNTGWLYVGSDMHVAGSFTASGNGPYTWPGAFDTSGLQADGGQFVS